MLPAPAVLYCSSSKHLHSTGNADSRSADRPGQAAGALEFGDVLIDDLDRTIETLLKRELPADLVGQVAISFAAPDAQFPPQSVTLPALNLFLYDVRENRDLRTNEWLLERQGVGGVLRRRAPARIDCAYLITAWTSTTTLNPAQDEHRMLGEVMRVLLRHATIPAAALQGSLRGQEPLLPTSALQANNLQSLGEFWQALGGKPRAALSYTVTISLDTHEPEEAPVVLERELRLRPDAEQ
jgi:hypothetical protein